MQTCYFGRKRGDIDCSLIASNTLRELIALLVYDLFFLRAFCLCLIRRLDCLSLTDSNKCYEFSLLKEVYHDNTCTLLLRLLRVTFGFMFLGFVPLSSRLLICNM